MLTSRNTPVSGLRDAGRWCFSAMVRRFSKGARGAAASGCHADWGKFRSTESYSYDEIVETVKERGVDDLITRVSCRSSSQDAKLEYFDR
jgi:hypothetical protein